MKKFFSIIGLVIVLLFLNACNQTNNEQKNQIENQEKTSSYLTVDDVFVNGDSLAGKTINVTGVIEDICKHTFKKFKIIGKYKHHFIKILLGNKFSSVDESIIGKKVKVTGKLIPIKMNANMVKEWEERMREKHKGEEDTQHFKEEITFIQNIYQQITSGKIPYYTQYTIEAEEYELE